MNNYYKNTNISKDVWKNRISLVIGGIFLVCVSLLWRLFDISVLNYQHYKALADNQHTIQKKVEFHRGKIYSDDFGSDEFTQLAINIERYNVEVVPKNVKDAKQVAQKLSPLLNMDSSEILKKIDNDKLYIPPLKKRIDKDLADKILALKLSGVLITSDDVRYYPQKNLASNILGFVNFEQDGKYGVEGYYDEQLKGKGGIIKGLKDTHGNLILSLIHI